MFELCLSVDLRHARTYGDVTIAGEGMRIKALVLHLHGTGRDHLHGTGRDHLHGTGRDHLHGTGRDHLHGTGRDHLHVLLTSLGFCGLNRRCLFRHARGTA